MVWMMAATRRFSAHLFPPIEAPALTPLRAIEIDGAQDAATIATLVEAHLGLGAAHPDNDE